MRHFWPFLRLAILVVIFGYLAFALSPTVGLTTSDDSTAFLVALSVFFVVVDVALTFVVPALTFTTRDVRNAFLIGFAMIRDDWPRSAWYAVAPPLALLLFVRAPLLSEEIGSVLRFLFVVFATLLALAFKGAIARHYLRLVEAERDGGVWGESVKPSSHRTDGV